MSAVLRLRFSAAAALIALAVPAHAQTAEKPTPTDAAPIVAATVEPGKLTDVQRAALARANAYFNALKVLSGDFVQVAPDGQRTEGKFYLVKPGKLRFQYSPPSPIEVVSDGRDVIVRDRTLDTQDLYPLKQTPLRFLTQPDIDLTRDSNVTGVYVDQDMVSIQLEEANAVGGKAKLLLMFNAGPEFTLRQWTVTDAQGLDTSVAVYNLDTASVPDDKLFRIRQIPYLSERNMNR